MDDSRLDELFETSFCARPTNAAYNTALSVPKVVLEPSNEHWDATFATPSHYTERSKRRAGARYLLKAAAQLQTATTDAIASAVSAQATGDATRLTLVGVTILLPQRSDAGTEIPAHSAAPLPLTGRSHPEKVRTRATLEWDAVATDKVWRGEYELPDNDDLPAFSHGPAELVLPNQHLVKVTLKPESEVHGTLKGHDKPSRLW